MPAPICGIVTIILSLKVSNAAENMYHFMYLGVSLHRLSMRVEIKITERRVNMQNGRCVYQY